MATLGLCMIVKNEAARIERCLAAVKPWLTAWVIVDTGSSDDTIARINDVMAGVPGMVSTSLFVDFATTRNVALDAARRSSFEFDYLLLLDADMELVIDDPGWRDHLTADAYLMAQRSPHLTYRNIRVLRRDAAARYVGATHEYLDVAGARANLDGAYFLDHADGANREGKFTRDIDLLCRDRERDPDNSRTVFYLAQSYRDLGNRAAALTFYERRAAMGGWPEEVYVALINAARLKQALDHPFAATLATWRRAMALIPARIEAVHGATRLCRFAGCHHEGYAIARPALDAPQPDGLFVEPWVYQWGLRDEFSVVAYWSGHYAASRDAAAAALRGDLDAVTRARIETNLAFAVAKLPKRHRPVA